jgi:uncharacterized protein YciI
MLWQIHCIGKPNMAAVRNEHVKAHRSHLDAHQANLFFAGGLQTDDASDLLGAMFILNVPTREEAQAFIDGEPFHRAGVFEKVTVTRLGKGRFNPSLADAV